MMAAVGDEYARVTAILQRVTPNAFLVATPGGGSAWIPRSLIHAADDRKIEGMFAGEAISLRLFSWKAEELGL